MLNPIKNQRQMLMELAGMPHYGGGGKTDILTGAARSDYLQQFAGEIKRVIREYTRAVGKPPTTAEIAQLEDVFISKRNPAPSRPQTLARTADQEKNANMLLDEFGRPYAPMIDPKTGKLTTPERAKGFTVTNQFEVNPQTRKARKGQYTEGYDQVARPDEFVQVANVGRTSNRTNQRSTLPSTEELLAMQHNAENAVDDLGGGLSAAAKTPGEAYGMAEGPTSASQIFGDMSGAIEHGKLAENNMGDLREQLVLALNPKAGEKVARPMKADIERARQSFLERGIEPDQEDIINAIIADKNAAQHDYLGYNPTAERTMNDPKAGKASPEYLAWQEQMRAAGYPKSMWNVNPADWDNIHKTNYLLDTAPEDRLPFAANWNLEELISNQGKKNVVKKAEGGFIPSPRDMRASLLVNGYGGGGRPEMPYDPDTATRAEHYTNLERDMPPMIYTVSPPNHDPSPSERIAALGQRYLEKAGIQKPTAKRLAQTMTMGGPDSYIPYADKTGISGLGQLGMMNRVGAALAAPIMGAEMAHSANRGDWDSVAANAIFTNPAIQGILGKRTGKAAPLSEKQSEYRSVLE